MRVPKEKAAENRLALLQAASRLFRRDGIDGVGVADIAREAGLTHGALYAHFPSKDALAAEAFAHGFDLNLVEASATVEGQRSFDDQLDELLSPAARDRLETGCPMDASASESARHGTGVSASFAGAFEHVVQLLEASLGDALPRAERRRLAVASVAAKIGAIAVSRAVLAADGELATEVLTATRTILGGLSKERKRLPSRAGHASPQTRS